MIRELVTDIDGKYLVTGKIKQLKNELILAAFYSNEKKKRGIDGMLVQRLDPATGNVLVSTKMDLNTSLISQVEDDDDDKRSKNKGDAAAAGLAANLVFRNFYTTPDNGLVILAERFDKALQSYSSTMSSIGRDTYETTTCEIYTCGDIYMAKISLAGKIDWLHVLPKNQVETLIVGNSMSMVNMFPTPSYFVPIDNRPFYAGFSSLAVGRTAKLFFNDNDKNADVLQPGKKIKRLTDFGRSSCYVVDLDMISGKYTRKSLYSNRDIPTSMPRLGAVQNNIIYLTGKEDRTMAKSRIVVGKIICAL
jgi:hypothetical protein